MAGALFGAALAHGDVVVTPWIPIFKGIERAVGTNFPSTTYTNNGVVYTDSQLQVANCLRIDLEDPDVQLFTTPRATNYIAESSETYTISISNFVKKYGVQVATVANFYNGAQGQDSPVEGLPSQVFGLSICTGRVVSVPDFGPDSNNRWASILFTTNKTPLLALGNGPPGTNIAGIYTAVSGYYAVLTNGVIIGGAALTATYPDPTFHNLQPRTVFGLSEDRRYLFMMVIDGRQAHSQGAFDNEMGFWLLQFGASDGIAMDGGGSAAMYMENCSGGNPIPIGKSSFVHANGRERVSGSHLGVYARPLSGFVSNIVATPGTSSAIISWNTLSNATTQVEYGTTPALGTLTPFDSTPVMSHTVSLSGLLPGKHYYYRVLSIAGGTQYTSVCSVLSFSTTNFAGGALLALNANWRYTTNNLDGVNWTSDGYDDSFWSNGPACLWAYSGNPSPNYALYVPNFSTGTRMPLDGGNANYPFPTYYFRNKFVYSNTLLGVTLIFSNYLDDGAIFYLNGSEIFRTNMPPGTASNSTTTPMNVPCNHPNLMNSATCPMIFTLSGNALSNLMVGTNVYAAELHNYRPGNPSVDVAFESAVHFTLPPPVEPPPFFTNVVIAPGEHNAVITWTTLSNSTAQIFYGTTPLLGSASFLDTNLILNHAQVLTGLQAVTTYYFRLVATNEGTEFTYDGTFSTVPFLVPLVTGTNVWRYATNDLTSTNWMAPIYNDSGWLGEGPALLYLENNVGVTPRITPVPSAPNGRPRPTYYFRTRFDFSGSTEGFALQFTNYIDDGAVFYLNGREVQRVRMNPGFVSYADYASGCPVNACEATSDVPDLFRLSGDALTNLVQGENVLAAEVHQHDADSSDIVFGSTLSLVRTLASETALRIACLDDVVCISWSGSGFILQQASAPGGGAWSDVPGLVTASPYCITNPTSTTFFRLRNQH